MAPEQSTASICQMFRQDTSRMTRQQRRTFRRPTLTKPNPSSKNVTQVTRPTTFTRLRATSRKGVAVKMNSSKHTPAKVSRSSAPAQPVKDTTQSSSKPAERAVAQPSDVDLTKRQSISTRPRAARKRDNKSDAASVVQTSAQWIKLFDQQSSPDSTQDSSLRTMRPKKSSDMEGDL
jgi:hypothetical protein